jgi:hypothetical protein
MGTITSTSRARIVQATNPVIYNLDMPNAGTEYAQSLNQSVKKLMIRMRTKAKAQIAFVAGDTSVLYFTLEPGAVYFEENLDLTGATIYLQSNVGSQVAEILEWT